MHRWNLLIVILISWTLAGCSDSPEHRLSQAELSLKQNEPRQALEYLDSVLADADSIDVENKDEIMLRARLAKARAHLALNQLTAAKKSLDVLREERPEDVVPVRALAQWAIRSLESALKKSDFAEDPELQDEFLAALDVGDRQADVLHMKHKEIVEAEMMRARLRLLDVSRIERVKKEFTDSLEKRRIR